VNVPLRSCPADRLSASDAAALRTVVRFVARRGVRAIGLVGDSSPRGAQAAAVVRAAAEQEHLAVAAPGTARDPLIIVSGWAAADPVIRGVSTGRVAAQGTYLAPWLLNAPLLVPPAGQLLPLRFNPGTAHALGYVVALNARFPGEPATAAGYAGWAEASRLDAAPLRLYAASQVFVPGMSGHEGHTTAGRWLPDGTVTPITGPLDET
jgi:hypothetical protein